jgi:hypothetical protein
MYEYFQFLDDVPSATVSQAAVVSLLIGSKTDFFIVTLFTAFSSYNVRTLLIYLHTILET